MLLLDLLGVPRLKLFVAPIVLRNSCPIAKSQNQEKKTTRARPDKIVCLSGQKRWSITTDQTALSRVSGSMRGYLRRTYKKRDKLLCPFRVAVALPCVSGVVYLCRDTFFVGFSAATACYYCIHIASFLHDFDRFSYSLSTASC
jgi:hypothetical protein